MQMLAQIQNTSAGNKTMYCSPSGNIHYAYIMYIYIYILSRV